MNRLPIRKLKKEIYIVWATGGRLVPDELRKEWLEEKQ